MDPLSTDAINEHVGRRLAKRRMTLRISQRKLGQPLKLSGEAIRNHEFGKTPIGVDRLIQLATMLEVPVGYFFEGLTDPKAGIDVLMAASDLDALPLETRQRVLSLVRSVLRELQKASNDNGR